MNLNAIARKVIKNTLEAEPSYRDLVAWPGTTTMFRTFGAYVPAAVPLPYVTMDWYAGGLDNDAHTAASRSYWKIAALTEEDEQLALDIQEAIHTALYGKMPVMGVVAGFAGYAPLTLAYPYFNTVNRQNRVYLSAGGIYTLYLAETEG